MAEVLRLQNVSRRYHEGGGDLEIFSGLDLSLQQGEIVALVGQSGAGKSSLLHMAGLLEAPPPEPAALVPVPPAVVPAEVEPGEEFGVELEPQPAANPPIEPATSRTVNVLRTIGPSFYLGIVFRAAARSHVQQQPGRPVKR